MDTVRTRQANQKKADTQGAHSQNLALFDSRRETFQYTVSQRYVSRSVNLDNGKTSSTKLAIGAIKTDSPSLTDPHSAFDHIYLRTARMSAPDTSLPAVRVVDLFSGCGGLSLGLRDACVATGRRFNPLLAVDKDSANLEVYINNFTPRQAFNRDIWTLVCGELDSRLEDCEESLLRNLGRVDVLLAGPPCQGNSNLNNHTRRKDYRNKLYERVARFAQIAEPKHIVIENVPTVVHGHDRAMDNTVELLTRCGYKVDTGVVDLAGLGVPQRRKRHVLIASLEKAVSVKDVVRRHQVSVVRDVYWAIGDLEQEDDSLFDGAAKLSLENTSRIEFLLKHGLYDLPNHLRPICHQNDQHTYRSMYGRLNYKEPAQTITTGFSSPGQGRYIHPIRPRTLTPHEAARLQFFPDSFDFSVAKTRTALATMIGNAVPMKLSYVFGLELLI